MPKFILSALPGLLVGLLVGFGLARIGGPSDEDKVAQERRVAKACVSEARKVLATDRAARDRGDLSRPGAAREAADKGDPKERAARTIETALKRARTEKKWTVAHGKAAERLFPRLAPEKAEELSKKILDAVEKGDITPEGDAWLPTKK